MWLALPLMLTAFLTTFFAAQRLTLPDPAIHDAGAFLGTPAGHALLHGSWGWFALIAIMLIFNTVLGEELLFRGLLVPRTEPLAAGTGLQTHSCLPPTTSTRGGRRHPTSSPG